MRFHYFFHQILEHLVTVYNRHCLKRQFAFLLFCSEIPRTSFN